MTTTNLPTDPPAGRADAVPGLCDAEVARRLHDDGPNELPSPKRPPAVRRFAAQLVHPFALLLWAAAGFALLGALPQLTVAIVIVVVLNATFAFVQEHRAGRAAERLRTLLPRRITVRRGGRPVEVDVAEVVVGDVVLLGAGDRVPADAEVRSAVGLLVDSSLLSGESVAAGTGPGDLVLAGTFIVEGEATAEVRATGGATRLAGIARLTTATPAPPSPLTLELHRVVWVVALIAVGFGTAFFATAMALGTAPADGFVLAIGVTVALVPEALLPTVTLSLAWGAEQMAKRQVLVRNLDAVETLGSTTFICTDKTGTLTRNEMTVVEAWTPVGSALVADPGYDPSGGADCDPAAAPAVAALARAAVRCSNGFVRLEAGRWRPHGDPMEAAVDVFGRRLGVDVEEERRTAEAVGAVRFPFDPRRRRMSVVTAGTVAVKGAPDSVLPRCLPVGGATEALDRFTAAGLRVLAVASRRSAMVPADADEAERDLELLGLLAMEDPPRHDVGAAVEACRRAGIKVAMITGDHPATAAAIGDEVGLRRPDAPVLVGGELPEDDQALGELLDRDGVVVARVSPEQKLRIAQALRRRGHVVAMTGDGVNDGPALHEADIGIAMGRSGTDVAREAADLVLLDDHFASIVAGIEQGRASFFNVRRFLTYHLTDNVAELTPFVLWALSGGRIPLALGVLQVLALDIGTDTSSAVALGSEPPAPHALDRPPVTGRLLDRLVARRAFAVLGPTEALLCMIAFFVSCVGSGWRPGEPMPDGSALAAASGAAFLAVVAAQAANAFACRSTSRPPWRIGWLANRLLPAAVAFGLALSLAAVFVAAVADQLEHARPTVAGWAVVAAAPLVLLGADALDKAIRRRPRPTPTTPEGSSAPSTA